MTFRVGQKVVCIDSNPASWLGNRVGLSRDMHGLTRGEIYTIRAIGTHEGFCVVWLVEIVRPCRGCGSEEVGYYHARFRPAVERKTDISTFTRMLDSVKGFADA
jgi:hypothetical protein